MPPVTTKRGKIGEFVVMPKSAGFWVASGLKSIRTRFRPALSSLVMFDETTLVQVSATK
jgi:hypothetical protein